MVVEWCKESDAETTIRHCIEQSMTGGGQRFEVLVGAAVLANNLMRIAAMLSKRSSRRRRAAQHDLSTSSLREADVFFLRALFHSILKSTTAMVCVRRSSHAKSLK